MKIKALTTVIAAFTLATSSSVGSILIGSLTTDGTGAGTITLTHDIVFTAQSSFNVEDFCVIGISSDYSGLGEVGNIGQTGSSLVFGGTATGSNAYIASNLGFDFGSILDNMATLEFDSGASRSMVLNDTATVSAGAYSVAYTDASGQNLDLELYSGAVFTNVLGTAYDVNATYNAVPEPSTYAAFAGLAALGVVAIRRRRLVRGA